MNETIRWTREDMILATIEHWDMDDCAVEDCEVCRSETDESPCLIVQHKPTGRTSDEAGNAGRWHLDGTPFTT